MRVAGMRMAYAHATGTPAGVTPGAIPCSDLCEAQARGMRNVTGWLNPRHTPDRSGLDTGAGTSKLRDRGHPVQQGGHP